MTKAEHRWALAGACAAVLVPAFVYGMVAGYSGWWWEALRAVVGLAAVVAVATARARVALVAVLAWLLVGSPIVARPHRIPIERFDRGHEVARGVPSGPLFVWTRSVPVAGVWIRDSDVPLGDYREAAKKDVVTWTVTWLPWPTVTRTRLHKLDAAFAEGYLAPRFVSARRDGDRLLIRGYGARFPPLLTEVRLGLADSWITLAGWLAIAAALVFRLVLPLRHGRDRV